MRSVVLLTVGAVLAGCEFIPGTTEHDIAGAEVRVARALGQEGSRNLRFASTFVPKAHPENADSTATVCGQVSMVGPDGSVSFGPRYLVDISSDVTSIQPTPPGGEYEYATRVCASAIRNMGLRETTPVTDRACQMLDREEARMQASMAFLTTFNDYCPPEAEPGLVE